MDFVPKKTTIYLTAMNRFGCSLDRRLGRFSNLTSLHLTLRHPQTNYVILIIKITPTNHCIVINACHSNNWQTGDFCYSCIGNHLELQRCNVLNISTSLQQNIYTKLFSNFTSIWLQCCCCFFKNPWSLLIRKDFKDKKNSFVMDSSWLI